MGATVVLQDVTRLRRFDELRTTWSPPWRTSSARRSRRCAWRSISVPSSRWGRSREAGGPAVAAREDCERLQGIVDDLLDLSRIQAGRMELHPREISTELMLEQRAPGHPRSGPSSATCQWIWRSTRAPRW